MNRGRSSGDLVVVADAHLGADDPELATFRAFLAARARDSATVVLLGDIFSLWLGTVQYTAPHHRAVLDSCRALRRSGVRVVFVEGNREFAAARWRGDAFDVVAEDYAAAPWGGHNWYFAHGDLLNRADRRGRVFRRLVRSGPVTLLFRALPGRIGLGVATRIERSLRHRNLENKRRVPENQFAEYVRWFARRGFDAGAIGHIHIELPLRLEGPDGEPRFLYVLPDWRSTNRFLRIPAEGAARFESFGAPRPIPPAVVEVVELEDRVTLRFDHPPGLEPGSPVAVSSGHGPEVREGEVVLSDPAGATIVLRLGPGPPVQVGDRLVPPSRLADADPEERTP